MVISSVSDHSANLDINDKKLPRILLVAAVPVICLTVFLYLWIRFPLSHPKHLENSGMNYVSGIYFANWSVYEAKHTPGDVDVANISHVFYAFMKIDPESGNVGLSDSWADTELSVNGKKGCLGLWMSLKKEHRHLKVVMSVGGWGTSNAFQETVKSEKKLQNFVESVTHLVLTYKFDGVDIDWEYPASPVEGSQLCGLLELLRASLDSVRDGMLLTVASPASSNQLENYDLERMDRVLSFWNVMCYDFAGAGWSSNTGAHLNLYGHNGDNDLNVDLVIGNYIGQGIHPQKLVMGMPMYGRSFYSPTTADLGASFSKSLPYPTDTVEYRDISDQNEVYDSTRVAAYMYDASKKVLVTYDNKQCVSEKGRYVTSHNLRGGFWWDSKGESRHKHHKLMNVFVDELGGPHNIDHSPNWI